MLLAFAQVHGPDGLVHAPARDHVARQCDSLAYIVIGTRADIAEQLLFRASSPQDYGKPMPQVVLGERVALIQYAGDGLTGP